MIAPTSANNAAVAGAWIPALVFGIPGDAVTAIVLGVLVTQGIRPGPMLFKESGGLLDAIFAIALITQFLLIPCGYAGIKFFAWILKLPRHIVLVSVLVFSIVGAFALHNSLFDVYVMIAFGIVGFFLEACRVPLAPMILGLILGPLVEEKLRAALIASQGSLEPFFTRPICVSLIAILAATLLARPIGYLIARALGRQNTGPDV